MKLLKLVDLDKKDCLLYWSALILSVFFIKFIIFCSDPLPMFFLGDSWSYLSTAIKNWIPPDRSFVYGFVIKYTAIASHSLTTLMSIQVATSGFNAILLSYILLEFFSVTPSIAFLCGLLCAIEPHQLMYERYIMTEAFSLFIFAVYMGVIFNYLKKPTLIFLIIIQVIGTWLISFRLNYLPIVLINAFLLPFLIIPKLNRRFFLEIFSLRFFLKNKTTIQPSIKTVAFHLLISILLTFTLHLGYKNLNGYLSKSPPAYQYRSGTIILTAFLPVVEPSDFPFPEMADKVFGSLKYDIRNHYNRVFHHWQPDGIIARINEAIPDSIEADNAAKITALKALKRDPLGIASVIMNTFADFWDLAYLKRSLLNDRGDRPLPEDMLKALRDNFSLDAEDLPFLKTFTNKYYMNVWFWYLFLLCLPFFAFLNVFICGRETQVPVFVVFCATFLIVIVSCTFCEGVTVRYLHALGWMAFLVIGPVLNYIFLKYKSHRTT